LYKLKLIDEIIAEPLGGAHRSIHDTVHNVEDYIAKTLRELRRTKIDNLLENRYNKLRLIGSTSADALRRKTEAGRERIAAALKALRIPSKPIPAKV
jgi:hypothetical protein